MPGILIVDDHVGVRRAIRSLLESRTLAVCGEAADGHEAIRKVRELLPDIVLMDVEMPGMNGLKATEEILRVRPSVKVVFLTMHTASLMGQEILSRTHGFVDKLDAGRMLIPVVRRLQLRPPGAERTTRNGSLTYAWQEIVADAFAASSQMLPRKINLAEKAISVRLTDANEPNRNERTALREALHALRQLISEARPDRISRRAGHNKEIA